MLVLGIQWEILRNSQLAQITSVTMPQKTTDPMKARLKILVPMSPKLFISNKFEELELTL